jgi:hypothetical protein
MAFHPLDWLIVGLYILFAFAVGHGRRPRTASALEAGNR